MSKFVHVNLSSNDNSYTIVNLNHIVELYSYWHDYERKQVYYIVLSNEVSHNIDSKEEYLSLRKALLEYNNTGEGNV